MPGDVTVISLSSVFTPVREYRWLFNVMGIENYDTQELYYCAFVVVSCGKLSVFRESRKKNVRAFLLWQGCRM